MSQCRNVMSPTILFLGEMQMHSQYVLLTPVQPVNLVALMGLHSPKWIVQNKC